MARTQPVAPDWSARVPRWKIARLYVATLPALRSSREKMLWIDRLIHRFHWEGIQRALGQSGAASLIEGRAHRVNAFLDELTARANDPALQASTRAWRADQRLRVETFERNVEARKRARAEA